VIYNGLLFFYFIKKMGSACSVINDTEFTVWMYDEINYQCLVPAITGILALISAGIGFAAFLSGAGVGALVGLGVA
jgi:hypothetical protein